MEAEASVREANREFYRALTALDLEGMDRLWVHAPWVRCVHPGWELLIGWNAVRASWEGIFANTSTHVVEPGDVEVLVAGELAWVSCIERIVVEGEVHFTTATNLFMNTEETWRMILHHASMIPVRPTVEPSRLVH